MYQTTPSPLALFKGEAFPSPPQDGDSVAVYGNVGSGWETCPWSSNHPILGRPGRAVVFSVGWGPPASVLPYRGPSSSPTCPRRLAWPQRAPCPSLAGFCSRPPTWAPGQALRQGPVQGNNATVFLMVEGRHKDEERHAQKKGRMELGEGALS